MRAKIWLMIGSIAMVAVLRCAPAWAQTCRFCIYSVKFTCGVVHPVDTSPPSEPPLKPGNYATAINIHNFHQYTVRIQKTAVIANPEDQQRGQTSPPQPVDLGPGQAIEIDCSDTVSLFPPPLPTAPPPPPNTFIKGFVDLRGPEAGLPSLSVTAVYTAQPTATAGEPAGAILRSW